MKFAILGDIHANLEALERVLQDAAQRGTDRFVSVGDLVGYNADPVACIKRLKKIKAAVVLGNHDYYASSRELPDNFNPIAKKAIVWTRRQLNIFSRRMLARLPQTLCIDQMTLVHSSLHQPEDWGYIQNIQDAKQSLECQTTPLCFFGHTHRPAIYRMKNGTIETIDSETVTLEPGYKYLINPGSVGQPRDRDPRTGYAIYDTKTKTVSQFRMEYDIETAQKKIEAAGLPESDALRLAIGR